MTMSAESVASPSMAAVLTAKSPAMTVRSSRGNVNTSFTCTTFAYGGKGDVDCRHCIEKWLNTPDSKAQCPMDRQPWGMSLLGLCVDL